MNFGMFFQHCFINIKLKIDIIIQKLRLLLIIEEEFNDKNSFYSEFQSRLKLIFIKNFKKHNQNLKKVLVGLKINQ